MSDAALGRARVVRGSASRAAADERLFRADEMDDLDQAVRAGTVRRVALPDLEVMLGAIWDGDVAWAEWRRRGVELELPGTSADGAAATLDSVAAAWRTWSAARRRWNTIAGVLLSLVALAAAFLATLFVGSH
ncbi:MAG: hypothetical protein U1A27_07815 [Phycisphaerae bacterium]